jgi:3-hydroxy acid dehydrogenase/malonic semialdehyde reductase
MTKKIILVTGATSGFGKAIAEKFASEGWNCIITGRRKERLKVLKEELEEKYGASVLAYDFDVTDKDQVSYIATGIPEEWKNIDLLVNNAGGAMGRDNFADADLVDFDFMIDTNVKGLLYVTKAIVPYMIRNNKGHIINIGSIAGKEVYENGNVYCAAKHATDAISKGLRIDLLKHNIKVTAIHPGAAETEFSLVRFKGDEDKAKKVYEGYMPLRAEDIADIVYYCASLPAHVCINDLVVTPTAQANSYHLFKS